MSTHMFVHINMGLTYITFILLDICLFVVSLQIWNAIKKSKQCKNMLNLHQMSTYNQMEQYKCSVNKGKK